MSGCIGDDNQGNFKIILICLQRTSHNHAVFTISSNVYLFFHTSLVHGKAVRWCFIPLPTVLHFWNKSFFHFLASSPNLALSEAPNHLGSAACTTAIAPQQFSQDRGTDNHKEERDWISKKPKGRQNIRTVFCAESPPFAPLFGIAVLSVLSLTRWA